MSSKTEQTHLTLAYRQRNESNAKKLLKQYYKSIENELVNSLSKGVIYKLEDDTELVEVLSTIYHNVFNTIEGTELFKAVETNKDDIREVLQSEIDTRINSIISEIMDTINTQLANSQRQAQSLAIELQITDGTQIGGMAGKIYNNYYNNHIIIQATTEVAWGVELGKRVHIVAVDDVLGSTVDKIIDLLNNGQTNEAVKLSRQAFKLGLTSINQDKLIASVKGIASTLRVVSPLAQAQAIAGLRKDKEQYKTDNKTWVTSGSNIRESHLTAGGQTVPIDEPYRVGGSLMLYPSDGSLGAQLKEIINCKCFSVYN